MFDANLAKTGYLYGLVARAGHGHTDILLKQQTVPGFRGAHNGYWQRKLKIEFVYDCNTILSIFILYVLICEKVKTYNTFPFSQCFITACISYIRGLFLK